MPMCLNCNMEAIIVLEPEGSGVAFMKAGPSSRGGH